MSRDNKPEAAAERRNDYAFWAIPGAATAVTYSLPLFHEIDFAVNEGYRKIPHGGIEEGGLLFGTVDAKGTKIEAFRPINCEHASGPSFLLSDHDLEVMAEQITNTASDPELEGMQLVGWFLAHTRGPLTLTEREAELCDKYFPKPGMVTVLVKPERFQPTRFGFLVRAANGTLNRDAVANAVILPLPGRGSKNVQGPIASIPAPATTTTPAAPSRPPDETAPADKEARKPARVESPIQPQQPPAEEDAAPTERPAIRRPARLKIDRVLAQPEPEEREAAASDDAPQTRSVSLRPSADIAEADPRRRTREVVPLSTRELEHDEELTDELPDPYRQVEMLTQKRPMSATARSVLVLPLAAVLGCLVGYIAYLQVPSPIIPLSVKTRGENLIVTWPAEQTRSAAYAAVRVDDSAPVPLTPEEKSNGRVEVQARPDMKVELIAHNWIHDSRGIVHYVKPVANTAP